MFNIKNQRLLFFLVFITMYTLLDSFNMSYQAMIEQYGLYLVLINITLNLFMSGLSAIMVSSAGSQIKEPKGANLSFASIVFGIFTYGCTTCVITFLASIGISFSVMALPFAGLPYKLVSVVLIIIGYFWTQREIRNAVCEI